MLLILVVILRIVLMYYVQSKNKIHTVCKYLQAQNIELNGKFSSYHDCSCLLQIKNCYQDDHRREEKRERVHDKQHLCSERCQQLDPFINLQHKQKELLHANVCQLRNISPSIAMDSFLMAIIYVTCYYLLKIWPKSFICMYVVLCCISLHPGQKHASQPSFPLFQAGSQGHH